MTFWFQELVLGLWFVVSLVRLSQFLIFGVTLSMRQAVWIQQGLWAVFKCRTVPHWYVLHTVSFDWFSTGLGWIINLEDFLLKLLLFYKKLLWNIRSRLNSSTFWFFRPVSRFKLKLSAHKMKILIKHI